jgi:peptide/nickel transport system permease protein
VAPFVVKRIVWAFVMAFIVSFITFVLFFIVPDITQVARSSSSDQLVSLARQYDVQGQSIFEQYGHFVWRFLRHGDLGKSFGSGQPVMQALASAVPVTAGLVIGGAILWVLIAFPIGILSALRPRSLVDRVTMIFVLVGVSAHPVWIGLILSYFLGFKFHITPIAGYCDFFNPTLQCGGALDWAYHMLLPWLTFALLFAALYTRMIRAMVMETLQEDYVRTAEAKGAGPFRILRAHVLRNAMLPIVTMLGMDIGVAFAGALFVEAVFDLPGVGFMLYNAATHLDLPVVMGVFMVVSLAVVFANLIADLVCMVLDPRMHVARASSYGRQRRPRVVPTRVGRASGPRPPGSATAPAPR